MERGSNFQFLFIMEPSYIKTQITPLGNIDFYVTIWGKFYAVNHNSQKITEGAHMTLEDCQNEVASWSGNLQERVVLDLRKIINGEIIGKKEIIEIKKLVNRFK